MSQIYEALKRAERETKPAALRQDDEAVSVDAIFQPAEMTVQAEIAPSAAEPRVDEATNEASQADEAIPAVVETSPSEGVNVRKHSLLDSCPVSNWTPSSKVILFADRQRGSSVGAEQFRRLRSRLYQMRDKSALKRVLVSSAIAGEGKTFVCANLAHVLARHGRTRVLLIDADLRKPSLHLELGTRATPGLSDYLAGDVDELAVMQRGQMENLLFIGGGTTVADPAEMASSAKFQKLLDRASELFDWVIVDSSPVVQVSDATLLARHCDGVLLVVKAETTPFDLAQKANEEFRNTLVLGVVLNQVDRMSTYTPYYYNTYTRPAAVKALAKSAG